MSEVWEAAGKVVVGLVCAKLSIEIGLARFAAGQTVYGQTVSTEAEAMSAIYPYAAAAAAIGVTAGTIIGIIQQKKIDGVIAIIAGMASMFLASAA